MIAPENELCVPFERNGTTTDDEVNLSGSPPLRVGASCETTPFHQSTPTTRGQFGSFLPPGNLVHGLEGSFCSESGDTFTNMKGMTNVNAIDDTRDIEAVSYTHLTLPTIYSV